MKSVLIKFVYYFSLQTKRKEKANKEKERQSPDGSGFAGLRKDSKSGSAPNGNQQQHGEFDDLISALRTGTA